MNVQPTLPLSIQSESSQAVTAASYQVRQNSIKITDVVSSQKRRFHASPRLEAKENGCALQFLQSSPHVLGREDRRSSVQSLCLQLETVTRHYFAMVIAGEGVFVTASLTLS